MFSTLKQRILLGVYIFLIISIPVGTYLASETQTIKSDASAGKKSAVKTTPFPSGSPLSGAKELLSLSESSSDSGPTSSDSSPSSSSPTIATSFGPTLALKMALEGRPANNQATKLFVGIVEGSLGSNPKFLLSFTVDLPASGVYDNLSLAGLNPGSQYTALLKGSAQIATSSAFIMSPTVSHLNEGQVVNMLTGDLNEDNVVNSSDLTIVQNALGSKNEIADFNSDGLVNTFDMAIIIKNMGQTGASGAWTSPLPNVASSSGSLAGEATLPTGSTNSSEGYWIWVPK